MGVWELCQHADNEVPKTAMGRLFATRRQIYIFAFFIFYLCVNISLLGLVSEQLHKYGNEWTRYPDGRWYHALGLGLFVGIFFTLFGIFHAWLGHKIYLFLFFAGAVMSGVVAGLFEMTPFGHGLQCGNPVDSFPEKYRPFYGECSRITAIEGLAWTMFALNIVGLFLTFIDAYSCTARNTHVYAPYEKPEKVRDIEGDADSEHTHV